MKYTISVILIAAVFTTGCRQGKSVKKDPDSGLTTAGENLTCEDVYLTVNGERTARNSFIYGETFYVNFDNAKGFAKVNGYVFPGLDMTVTNQGGDTIWQTGNLYSGNTGGFNYSPLKLVADLTLAAPIQSKGDYTLFVNIWDDKGNGTFKSKFNFKVRENELITVESSGVSYNEAYLFSQGNNKVITDNIIKYNDNIYVIIEGLKGFKEENGLVYPGMSVNVIDAANNMIIESEDIFVDYGSAGVAATDLAARVSTHFRISGKKFSNPVHCEAVLWDKKSDARIKVKTDITLE